MYLFYILHRSEVSGNCLYSSASLALVGSNTFVNDLRMLTSLELFINANFYSQHPCFLSAVNDHHECFGNINNLLPLSVCLAALDTGLTKDELVKQEAILNFTDGKWASFLCILALSSVLCRNIYSCHPDCGELRYKLLYNRLVQSRQHVKKGVIEDHLQP